MASHPDSDDVDLHGHQQSIQDHQQGRDAEPQVLGADVLLCKLPQLNGLCDERQNPVDEQDCEDREQSCGPMVVACSPLGRLRNPRELLDTSTPHEATFGSFHPTELVFVKWSEARQLAAPQLISCCCFVVSETLCTATTLARTSW